MADDNESIALAIEDFIAALGSKAHLKIRSPRGIPRTGRERPLTKDEIYVACLKALSVDERASLSSIIEKMHRTIGDLPDEILEPRRQPRP